MEDVLGGFTDPSRFDAFLTDRKVILARRVDEAVAALAAVEGLRGLVLAVGVGRGVVVVRGRGLIRLAATGRRGRCFG